MSTIKSVVPNLVSVFAPLIGPKVITLEPHSLDGRVALVTGGAEGIGYEVSRAFAKAGARVIMTNRKEEQGEDKMKLIRDESPEAKIEWIGCDLGNLKEVKEVFGKFANEEDRLDILVCSAGVNVNKFGLDADGIDRHMGVNWFGHYFLLNLLYPLIRRTSQRPNTPAPRIVWESSELHRQAPKNMHFGSMAEINDDSLSPIEYYGRTKAAMILGSKYGLYEEVIKKNGDNVYTVSLHPGGVSTRIQEQWKEAYEGPVGKMATAFAYLISRDVEQGSYSALYAATSDDIIANKWNGYYLTDPETPGKETAQCSDPMLGKALWELSERYVKEKMGEDALNKWDA